jgi:hypothetical protein
VEAAISPHDDIIRGLYESLKGINKHDYFIGVAHRARNFTLQDKIILEILPIGIALC